MTYLLLLKFSMMALFKADESFKYVSVNHHDVGLLNRGLSYYIE